MSGSAFPPPRDLRVVTTLVDVRVVDPGSAVLAAGNGGAAGLAGLDPLSGAIGAQLLRELPGVGAEVHDLVGSGRSAGPRTLTLRHVVADQAALVAAGRAALAARAPSLGAGRLRQILPDGGLGAAVRACLVDGRSFVGFEVTACRDGGG